jgi:hypothetical protein
MLILFEILILALNITKFIDIFKRTQIYIKNLLNKLLKTPQLLTKTPNKSLLKNLLL